MAQSSTAVLVDRADRMWAPRSARENLRAIQVLIESGEPPDDVLPEVLRLVGDALYLLSGYDEATAA